jgi:hypothetical protein
MFSGCYSYPSRHFPSRLPMSPTTEVDEPWALPVALHARARLLICVHVGLLGELEKLHHDHASYLAWSWRAYHGVLGSFCGGQRRGLQPPGQRVIMVSETTPEKSRTTPS